MNRKAKRIVLALSLVITVLFSGDALITYYQGKANQSVADFYSVEANGEKNK